MTVFRGRFALACAVAAAVILSAPFMSQIRRQLRSAFPEPIALLIGVPLIVALVRVRERRALRYGALAAAVALGVGYSTFMRTGFPDVDAVERFHFVEFGLVTLLFYRAWRPLGDVSMFVLPVLAGLLTGTLEEWFQWFVPVRVGEMKDIFLNTAAIGSGLLFSIAVDPPPPQIARLRPGSPGRICRFAAAVGVTVAAFFHTVHLGYEIHDAEAGTFRSRHDAAGLGRLAADRAARWQSSPPPLTVPRVSREDQYLTEAVEHAAERNDQWDEGSHANAWLENRVLEKYYAPALDTPSYHSTTGLRWPEEQRRNAQAAVDAARAAGADPATGYVSDSNPAPIYTWSKPRFWTVILAGAAAIVLFGAYADRRMRPAARHSEV
jgi:hypothetical protein